MALPSAGEDGGEEQQGDERQQDGQHQHSSCQGSRQEGHEEVKEQLPSSLGNPDRKGGAAFPF